MPILPFIPKPPHFEHPLPFQIFISPVKPCALFSASGIWLKIFSISFFANSFIFTSSRQFKQIFLTNLCATTARSDEATKNGSIFISMRRGMAPQRIIRVKRGKNYVSGERRVDRELRRFRVPNFSNHHDVRILAQNRAQSRSKRISDLRLDLALIDAFNGIFNRIFKRDDVHAFFVENAENRIKRCGLSRIRSDR